MNQPPVPPSGYVKAMFRWFCLSCIIFILADLLLSMFFTAIFGVEFLEARQADGFFSFRSIAFLVICWILSYKGASWSINKIFYPDGDNPIELFKEQMQEYIEKSRDNDN